MTRGETLVMVKMPLPVSGLGSRQDLFLGLTFDVIVDVHHAEHLCNLGPNEVTDELSALGGELLLRVYRNAQLQ